MNFQLSDFPALLPLLKKSPEKWQGSEGMVVFGALHLADLPNLLWVSVLKSICF
jgi:hypothetical protein